MHFAGPRSSRSSPDALAAEAWLAAGASPIGAPLLARSFSGPTPAMLQHSLNVRLRE